mmetsp:Transcript_19960/g.57824  ORF Transcript_19960/g.57824 Transcript_19960/m.57824 type:complete len:288 (-) Transcript_19960:248-1111(-)
MNEYIRKVSTLHSERSTVNDGVTLVQNHVPRLHRHVVRPPVVSDNLDRPRFVQILIDVNDGRTDQRQTIDVRGEEMPALVHPNAVQRAGLQRLSRPFLQRRFRRVPHGPLDGQPTADEIVRILDVDHVRRFVPIIDVGVSLGPLFLDPFGFVPVVVPETLQDGVDGVGTADLQEARFGEVLHIPRLLPAHPYALLLALVAQMTVLLPPVFPTTVDQIVVVRLSISQGLQWHAVVFGRGGMIIRVDVVREPRIIRRYGIVVHGDGHVDSVFRRRMFDVLRIPFDRSRY